MPLIRAILAIIFSTLATCIVSAPVLATPFNTNAPFSSHYDIAELASGNWVIVGRTSDGNAGGIQAAIYDSSDNLIGSVPVNTSLIGEQLQARVTALGSGDRFVVVFYDNNGQLARYRVFDGLTPVMTADDRLHPQTPVRMSLPEVALLDNGDFVAVWVAADIQTSAHIRGRILDPNGTPRSAIVFQIDSPAGVLYGGWPGVVAISGNRFVVTWMGRFDPNVDVFARLYTVNGNSGIPVPVGSEPFIVGVPDTGTDDREYYPSIARLSNGFAVTYLDLENGNISNDPSVGYDVRVAFFDLQGNKQADRIVDTGLPNGCYEAPDIAALANDDVVVTWGRAGGSTGCGHVITTGEVMSRSMGSSGTPPNATQHSLANASDPQLRPRITTAGPCIVRLAWNYRGTLGATGSSHTIAETVPVPGCSTAPTTASCTTADPLDRVFYAPFDTVIGPDVVSNTPNTGTPPGPNRYLTATNIPGHTGQVLHLNHVNRQDTTNYSGRVRFLRNGMSGRSPFGFRRGDFSINFWIRTSNDHARLIGTRQRNNDGGNRQRGVMVNLQNGQLEFQMNLGESAQGLQSPWFRNWRGGPNIADNQWHMITVAVDRDNATGGTLHVDGNVVATFDPTRFSGNLGNRNFLGLGFDGVTQGNDGDFEIDEIEIYHRVLDTPEITGRFASQLCQ